MILLFDFAMVAGSDNVEDDRISGHRSSAVCFNVGAFRRVQGARWRLQTQNALLRSGGDDALTIAAGSSGSRSCAASGASLGGGGASSAKARPTRWKRIGLQVAGGVTCEQARGAACSRSAVVSTG